MLSKTKRITAIVLVALTALMLIVGGVLKLLGAEPESVVQFLTHAGFGHLMPVLGITELGIAGLLLYPKTNKIGFLLTSCYLSGALSLEISAGAPPASLMFLVLIWIAMFLKNKEMFLPSTENHQ
ncbi:DoxX family protein [Xanthocytophaga agilis]|uniref:DoxX family protein n=1 Tax=Xanthocytophaga agilis TaxID=3048010 RepID=A0AAE3UEG7_9BACT|nr:DoxX family protein [Xanthocytophaga agilis]MDJ1502768.1 DoxX family protein [Xanthocytophaga agilis]